MAELIYHGSNQKVENPKILIQGFYKDFGYGFYCTKLEKQAIRWASIKRNPHIVNIYEYEQNSDLNTKIFPEMTEEWLDFIADCRTGKEHNFDIVEGPMADDTIWDYVEDFLANRISRAAFWELAKFKHPTHQILFCTEKSLQTITFLRSYEV